MDDEELRTIRRKKTDEYMAMDEKKSSGKSLHLADSEFEEFVKENALVVVDCYADWCMPCKMVAPIIEELAKEMSSVAFAKLNVDENQRSAMRYSIMSIPTILLFRNGELVDQVVGALPKATLKDRIERIF